MYLEIPFNEVTKVNCWGFLILHDWAFIRRGDEGTDSKKTEEWPCKDTERRGTSSYMLWSWIFSLQIYEKINFQCLSHLVNGVLLCCLTKKGRGQQQKTSGRLGWGHGASEALPLMTTGQPEVLQPWAEALLRSLNFIPAPPQTTVKRPPGTEQPLKLHDRGIWTEVITLWKFPGVFQKRDLCLTWWWLRFPIHSFIHSENSSEYIAHSGNCVRF